MSDLGKWPAHGPSFNEWRDDLVRLATILADASDESWWCADTALKYLEIRVDTRDGGFVLYDRDRNKISPERVEQAIAKWRTIYGKNKIRRSAPSPREGGR